MHRRHIGADGMCRPAAIGREPLLPARGERVRALRLAERQSSSHRLIARDTTPPRSEEHTSELQSLMRISYAVFCLKKKKQQTYLPITLYNTSTTTKTSHNS